MVNYYDEPQDNGTIIPGLIGTGIGAAGAGVLAHKYTGNNAHGLESDKLPAESNLGKIKAGKEAIGKAQATDEKAFSEAQEKLTLEKMEHDFNALDEEARKKSPHATESGSGFDHEKAKKAYGKLAVDAKVSPVQYESALHELEQLARMSPEDLAKSGKADMFNAIKGDIIPEGAKLPDQQLVEEYFHKNKGELSTFTSETAGADHVALKNVRETRATAAHPVVEHFDNMKKPYDEVLNKKAADKLEVRDKIHADHKNMTPDQRLSLIHI